MLFNTPLVIKVSGKFQTQSLQNHILNEGGKMVTKKGLITLFIILAFISTRVIAIAPTDDTFIDELYGDNVNGALSSLIVRCMNLNPGELDTLIKFDLTNIPAEATIKSAMLNLYYFHWNDLNPTGRQLDIYRITQDWSEDTTSWNNRPSYNSTAIDSISAPPSDGWVQWDVTSSAQDFHDGTYPNHGWQIMDVESSGNSMIYFHSSNYNTDPNLRPCLDITTNIIYVDQNATGANDGSSWADACNYLQDALNKPPAAGDRIWVAAGTYKPDQGGGKTPGDRTATFQLINNVKIYGGFAGNETAGNQRDWENNVTILSGDIGITETNSDNSYHVVTGSSTNSTALIDGFTITRGNANNPSTHHSGGGMYNNGGSPTLRNCTFSLNNAFSEGGGMYNYHCSPTLTSCRFNNNSAICGGAICAYENCNSKIINCTFTDNFADMWGGGVFFNFDCNPTLVNCIFIGNYADDNGGAMYNKTLSDPVVTNCTFWDNSTVYYGGGIFNSESSDPIVTNCILWANTSGYGTVQDAQIYGDSPVVTFSCIQDSDPDDDAIPFGGAVNNNIDDDPLFDDTANENLRLSYSSPCIETADNAIPADTADIDGDGVTIELVPWDIDKHPRFIDGDCDRTETADMGAYEFGWIYIGDLDGDCDVDFADFAVTANHWLYRQ